MITIGYANRGACIVRALVAIGLGAMMIGINNFTTFLVKIIAIVLALLGILSFVYQILNKEGKYRLFSQIGAIVVIGIAALMFFQSDSVAKALVILICIGVALGALFELLVFGSMLRFSGFGLPAIIISAVLFIVGIALLFTDVGLRITSILAGVIAILYGIHELVNLPRVRRFIIDSEPTPPSADIEEQ